MELVKFAPKSRVKELLRKYPAARFYDTSLHAAYASDFPQVKNASEFCPFVPYGNIPVPKMDCASDSVEGIWQGLKIIRGKIAPAYFHGKGRKRYGKPRGHQFGKKVLGYVAARKKIFVPAYEFMFYNCVPEESIRRILGFARDDVKQFFFDVDENGDIGNRKSPLAHSAVLVDIINRELSSGDSLRRYRCEAKPARR